MSILPGSFIDNRVDIDIINDSNLSLQLKHNEFNVLKSITNFNISVQNINNAKRSELLHNYDFIITSTCSNIKQINIYESMYTDVIFLSEFVAEISGKYNYFHKRKMHFCITKSAFCIIN